MPPVADAKSYFQPTRMDKDGRTMTQELAIAVKPGALTTGGSFVLPAVVADQGEKSAERFFTFFTGTILKRRQAERGARPSQRREMPDAC
jgi:hypothetical protein